MNSIELKGKEILAVLWMKNYFYLCLDDGSDLQISNHNAFWRLIKMGRYYYRLSISSLKAHNPLNPTFGRIT